VSQVTLMINDTEVTVEEGTSLLEAARGAKAFIPSLCYNRNLTPFGACRLCLVEIIKGGRSKLVASCVYPVEEGLQVKTDSEPVLEFRKGLMELLLANAPDVKVIQNYAKRYGVEKPRIQVENFNLCILCGLCVRYCAEIKGESAVGFQGRGTTRRVAFLPEIASQVCVDCKECFSVCPTKQLPAIYEAQIESPPANNETDIKSS